MFTMTGNEFTEQERARVALAIDTRRAELNLTWQQLAARSDGSPSTAKVRSFVRGQSHTFSPALRRRLEKALEWTPGSFERVAEGKPPTPLSDEAGAFIDRIRHPSIARTVNAALDSGDTGLLAVLEELLETGQLPANAQVQLERLRDEAIIKGFPQVYEKLTRPSKLKVATYGQDVWLKELKEEGNALSSDSSASSGASPEGDEDEEGGRSSDDGESGAAAVDAAVDEVLAELEVDGVDDDRDEFG